MNLQALLDLLEDLRGIYYYPTLTPTGIRFPTGGIEAQDDYFELPPELLATLLARFAHLPQYSPLRPGEVRVEDKDFLENQVLAHQRLRKLSLMIS